MSAPTLHSLFFADGTEAVGDDVAKDAVGTDAALIDLQGEIEQQLPELSANAVREELNAKIGEVLGTGIDEVLVASWRKFQDFQEYADPAKHPPEETILVPLAEHTIRSSHHPHVDLMVKNVTIGSVHLVVELALALEGVVLKIQGGKIRDVRGGSCRASGTLLCSVETRLGAKELLNVEKETRKFELRGAIRLGDGIAIPPPGGAKRPEEGERP